MTVRTLLLLLLIAATSAGAAGCGRKAPPDKPEGATYPRTYPSW